MVAFSIESLSVQRVVKRIQFLVLPDPCAMPKFHVVRTSVISQTQLHSVLRTNEVASHFKLNRVMETWVTSSIPISLSPFCSITPCGQQEYFSRAKLAPFLILFCQLIFLLWEMSLHHSGWFLLHYFKIYIIAQQLNCFYCFLWELGLVLGAFYHTSQCCRSKYIEFLSRIRIQDFGPIGTRIQN